MPGDDRHKIEKATTLGVDCICMDIEDGVAASRKGAARETIAAALDELDFGAAEVLVRINPIGSGLERADLAAVLPGRPDGIVIPKVTSAAQLQWVAGEMTRFEAAQGWEIGSTGLVAIVETAAGFINLDAIGTASRRLRALIYGADDLAADIGATRTREAWEGFYARSKLVLHAAAYGLGAIDMVYIDLQDLDGLAQEARQGARLGYHGKQIIHPNQVAPVQAAFTPGEAEIARAQRLLAAYSEHLEHGTGAFALDGIMVDAPLVRAAEGVMARARAAGAVDRP